MTETTFDGRSRACIRPYANHPVGEPEVEPIAPMDDHVSRGADLNRAGAEH